MVHQLITIKHESQVKELNLSTATTLNRSTVLQTAVWDTWDSNLQQVWIWEWSPTIITVSYRVQLFSLLTN